MMSELCKGRYRARTAISGDDRSAIMAMRQLAFRGGQTVSDQDRFDPVCQHVLVEDMNTLEIVCSFRLMPLVDGSQIALAYCAQFYGLDGLSSHPDPMMEVGRFCVNPQRRDPDVLRIALAAMTRIADVAGVRMLFGCCSFPGTRAAPFADVFALLGANHIGPQRWRPTVKSSDTVHHFRGPDGNWPDKSVALRAMPPLLRGYLGLGGWVGDHAVIDPDLNTLHVFTALDVGSIPPARLRSLRLAAG
jgi:putative hemolysin